MKEYLEDRTCVVERAWFTATMHPDGRYTMSGRYMLRDEASGRRYRWKTRRFELEKGQRIHIVSARVLRHEERKGSTFVVLSPTYTFIRRLPMRIEKIVCGICQVFKGEETEIDGSRTVPFLDAEIEVCEDCERQTVLSLHRFAQAAGLDETGYESLLGDDDAILDDHHEDEETNADEENGDRVARPKLDAGWRRPSASAVRTWARKVGLAVSERGRVNEEIYEKYRIAHGE